MPGSKSGGPAIFSEPKSGYVFKVPEDKISIEIQKTERTLMPGSKAPFPGFVHSPDNNSKEHHDVTEEDLAKIRSEVKPGRMLMSGSKTGIIISPDQHFEYIKDLSSVPSHPQNVTPEAPPAQSKMKLEPPKPPRTFFGGSKSIIMNFDTQANSAPPPPSKYKVDLSFQFDEKNPRTGLPIRRPTSPQKWQKEFDETLAPRPIINEHLKQRRTMMSGSKSSFQESSSLFFLEE